MNPPPPFQSIPPLLGFPPTLLANLSFQVFFINRNGTVKLSYYNIIDKTTFHQMYFAIQNILIYFQSTTNIFLLKFYKLLFSALSYLRQIMDITERIFSLFKGNYSYNKCGYLSHIVLG